MARAGSALVVLLLAAAAAAAAAGGAAAAAGTGAAPKKKPQPDPEDDAPQPYDAAQEKDDALVIKKRFRMRLANPPKASANCSAGITGIMAPFSVAYWGARVGPDGGALHDFRIQAWPDTGRDSNGKRYNVYCAAGAKNHITPTNLKGQAGLDHPCCSRAAAGAPRELRVTLKPGACSAAEGLSQISVLLNGSPVPPGVVTRKFAAAGSVVAVSLPAWPGGAAPEARAEFTLSFPPGHACAADPCPTGGCRYYLAASPAPGSPKNKCCGVQGSTWDAFAPHELAKRQKVPFEGMAERYMIVGDVGGGVDGNRCTSNGKKLPPFTDSCRAEQLADLPIQHEVARQMAKVAAIVTPTYVLNTGDNYYELGFNNTQKELFKRAYEDVYFQYESLSNVTWMSVLGNHDIIYYISYIRNNYTGVKTQPFGACTPNLVPHASEADCLAAACCYSPIFQYTAAVGHPLWRLENGTWEVKTPLADLIFVDTNPFAYPTSKSLRKYVPGGLAAQNTTATRALLQEKMARPQGAPFKWKVVIGHHTLQNYGSHCVIEDKGKWEPYPQVEDDCANMEHNLKADALAANLPLWINGHDHNQQVAKINKTWVVTTGAGLKMSGMVADNKKPLQQPPLLVWPKFGVDTCYTKDQGTREPNKIYMDHGFGVLGIDPDRMVFSLYNAGTYPDCLESADWMAKYWGHAFEAQIDKKDFDGGA